MRVVWFLLLPALLFFGCTGNPPSSSNTPSATVFATPEPTISIQSSPSATPNPCRSLAGESRDACYVDLAKRTGNLNWCVQIPDESVEAQLECTWTMAYRLQDARACKWLTDYKQECLALAARDAALCGEVPDESKRRDCHALFEAISAAGGGVS